MTSTAPTPRHASASHTFDVAAPIDAVFPLFGPIEERRWAPGWDPEMLHLAGDGTGVGTVFRTVSSDAGGDVVWTLADFDPATHRARYVRVAPATHAGIVTVRCDAITPRSTRVTVGYALTALGARGDAYVRAFFDDGAYVRFIDGWRDPVTRALRDAA